MANYAALIADIRTVIKQNGNQEITGNLLQQSLVAMINSLGNGYLYRGIANPSTNPGTPDQNIFYIATVAGIYVNMGGLTLDDGEVAIIKYNGAWSKDITGIASLQQLSQLGQELNLLGQKVSNRMALLSYDTQALGIISLETSFDFDSAVLTEYGNRNRSDSAGEVSQVIRLRFTVAQNTYKYYYTAQGENIRTGYQRLQIPAASVSQNVGDVYVGIIWQPYYNTSLNIDIYKGNVKRLLTDYSTKDNATKSVDKIFFDGSDVLGIKSIATDFDFTSAAIKRYINRTASAGVNSQYIIINFVVAGQSIDFIYTDQVEVVRTGVQVITFTNSGKTVILVVDWQRINQSTLNYALNKSSINVLRESQISALAKEMKDVEDTLSYDESPDAEDWQNGGISPLTGAGGSSVLVFRVNNVNYTAYCIRTAITQVVPIHPIDGSIPANVKNIVSNNANVYFFVCAYDAENNYIGVYDVDTDTFVTSWGGTARIASVYQRMDFLKLKTKYPAYQFAIALSDITATSAISKDDVATYLKYEISFIQLLKDNIAESELPCNYTGEEMSVFTRGLFIGDSLTAGTFNHNEGGTMEYEVMPQFSFPKQIERFLGISITNKGVGGATCATWWEAHQNDTDYGNHDFCLIQLGINDVGKQPGGWNAQSTQSLLNIIAKVKAENSKIKVFVATIIPSSYYKGVNSQTGGSYDAASQAIRDAVAGLADPNVILVDIARYGHTGKTYYSNGHLNALGYQRLAKDYIAYLSWIIKNNPEQFTQTAFIGTNMSYN